MTAADHPTRAPRAAGAGRPRDAHASGQASPPLWQTLLAASQVLLGVLQGQPSSASLAQVSPSLRPGAQALAFAGLRGWARAHALLRARAARMPPAPVRSLLLLGLALVTENPPRYDAHTLTNQLVEACQRQRSTRAAAGFVNGCMRQTLRAGTLGLASLTQADQLNLPDWWLQQLQADHPTHWLAIAQAAATPAPMHLRQHARKSQEKSAVSAVDTPQAAIKNIASPLRGDRWGGGWALHEAVPVQQLPGWDQGWWSVQDWGAQQAAPALLAALVPRSDGRRPRVLDACAAPGGKTAHLLELADLDLLAIDRDADRLARVQDNLQRLGLAAHLRCADAARPAEWWDGQAFDAILLDAPCTASGIVRRHPDVPWLRRATDIASLAQQQRALLDALWPTLAPGGALLYCTCSVFAAEGPEQIQAFVARNTDAVPEPSIAALLPTSAAATETPLDNLLGEHDGFFYALLRKRPTGAA